MTLLRYPEGGIHQVLKLVSGWRLAATITGGVHVGRCWRVDTDNWELCAKEADPCDERNREGFLVAVHNLQRIEVECKIV